MLNQASDACGELDRLVITQAPSLYLLTGVAY